MTGYPVERWRDVFETMFFLLFNRKNIDEFVSVSSCYIPKKSWLGKQMEELKIEYNDKSEWHIGRVNTPCIRESRKKLLMLFAGFLGLYKGGDKMMSGLRCGAGSGIQ